MSGLDLRQLSLVGLFGVLMIGVGCEQSSTHEAAPSAETANSSGPAPLAAESSGSEIQPHSASGTTTGSLPAVEPTASSSTAAQQPVRLVFASGNQSENPPRTLAIGDPAPALAISEVMTGAPLTQLDPGKVYVVEFWATWCGPCLRSMPHISQLQTEYDGQIEVIGFTQEEAGTVSRFLTQQQSAGKTWRDAITYRLVIDDRSQTNAAYMQAAGQNGIPCAFIVGKEGVIEWIGHPMTIDEPLAKVVAGEWDRAAMVAQFAAERRREELLVQLGPLVRARRFDDALKMLDAQEQESPSPELSRLRVYLLEQAGRTEEAAAAQSKLVDAAWDNAMILNEVAWSIAISAGENRNLALARKAAERASELTEHQDGSILDTLARVHFEQGDLDQAVEWQRKAVEHADGNPTVQQALERYLELQAARASAATPEVDATAPESTQAGEATAPAGTSTPETELPPADDAPAASETVETEATE